MSGWHLGVVRDRTDAALLAFLERQTGLEHTRFLVDAASARRMIESLKGWLAREAGVEWPASGSVEASKAAAGGRSGGEWLGWCCLSGVASLGRARTWMGRSERSARSSASG